MSKDRARRPTPMIVRLPHPSPRSAVPAACRPLLLLVLCGAALACSKDSGGGSGGAGGTVTGGSGGSGGRGGRGGNGTGGTTAGTGGSSTGGSGGSSTG